jgi:hypothetical protein
VITIHTHSAHHSGSKNEEGRLPKATCAHKVVQLSAAFRAITQMHGTDSTQEEAGTCSDKVGLVDRQMRVAMDSCTNSLLCTMASRRATRVATPSMLMKISWAASDSARLVRACCSQGEARSTGQQGGG